VGYSQNEETVINKSTKGRNKLTNYYYMVYSMTINSYSHINKKKKEKKKQKKKKEKLLQLHHLKIS